MAGLYFNWILGCIVSSCYVVVKAQFYVFAMVFWVAVRVTMQLLGSYGRLLGPCCAFGCSGWLLRHFYADRVFPFEGTRAVSKDDSSGNAFA